MNKIKIASEIVHYDSIDELSEVEQSLINKAYEYADYAYAPYSKFRVGCAILLENGKIVGGSNQENASYPAGICAERTALSTCSSLYPNTKPLTLAIVVNDKDFISNVPCAPCGICRQSISETEARYGQVEIIFPAPNKGFYKISSIESILPFMFNGDSL